MVCASDEAHITVMEHNNHTNKKKDIAWKWINPTTGYLLKKEEHFTLFSIPGWCAVQVQSDCSCPFSLCLKAVCHLDPRIIKIKSIFDQKQDILSFESFASFLLLCCSVSLFKPAVYRLKTLSILQHIPKNWILKHWMVVSMDLS